MDVCKLCNFDELNMKMRRKKKEYLLDDACAEGTSDDIVTNDQIQTVSRGLGTKERLLTFPFTMACGPRAL